MRTPQEPLLLKLLEVAPNRSYRGVESLTKLIEAHRAILLKLVTNRSDSVGLSVWTVGHSWKRNIAFRWLNR